MYQCTQWVLPMHLIEESHQGAHLSDVKGIAEPWSNWTPIIGDVHIAIAFTTARIKDKKSQDVQDNGSKTSSCSVGQRMPKVVRFKLLVPVIQIGSVIV